MVHQGCNEILCSVCQTPLTDKTSVAAGKGKICRDRTRFAETVSREELPLFQGPKEPISSLKNTFKTAIIKINEETDPRLITILKKSDSAFYFMDLTESSKLYDQNLSVTDSIINSFYSQEIEKCDSYFHLISPENEGIKEKFRSFQEGYREEIKKRPNDLSESGFISVKSFKLLDKDKLADRKNLSKQLKDSSDKANYKWSRGEFSLSTIMFRINKSEIPGAKEILSALKFQFSEIKPYDHGFTDNEILLGLQQANKPLEKRLFSALLKGKSNLLEITELYKKIKENKNPDDLKLFLEKTN